MRIQQANRYGFKIMSYTNVESRYHPLQWFNNEFVAIWFPTELCIDEPLVWAPLTLVTCRGTLTQHAYRNSESPLSSHWDAPFASRPYVSSRMSQPINLVTVLGVIDWLIGWMIDWLIDRWIDSSFCSARQRYYSDYFISATQTWSLQTHVAGWWTRLAD